MSSVMPSVDELIRVASSDLESKLATVEECLLRRMQEDQSRLQVVEEKQEEEGSHHRQTQSAIKDQNRTLSTLQIQVDKLDVSLSATNAALAGLCTELSEQLDDVRVQTELTRSMFERASDQLCEKCTGAVLDLTMSMESKLPVVEPCVTPNHSAVFEKYKSELTILVDNMKATLETTLNGEMNRFEVEHTGEVEKLDEKLRIANASQDEMKREVCRVDETLRLLLKEVTENWGSHFEKHNQQQCQEMISLQNQLKVLTCEEENQNNQINVLQASVSAIQQSSVIARKQARSRGGINLLSDGSSKIMPGVEAETTDVEKLQCRESFLTQRGLEFVLASVLEGFITHTHKFGEHKLELSSVVRTAIGLLEAELKQDVDSVDRHSKMLLKKMSDELSSRFNDWVRPQLQEINSLYEQFQALVDDQEVQRSRLNALQTAFTEQLEAGSSLMNANAAELDQRVEMMQFQHRISVLERQSPSRTSQPGSGVLSRPERGSGLIHSMSPQTRQAASLDLSASVNGDAQPGPGVLIRPERGSGLTHSMSPGMRQAASLDLSPIVNGDAQAGPNVLIRPERGGGLIHSMSPRMRQAASLDLSPIVNGDAQPGPGVLIRPERGSGLIHSMSPRMRQAASLDLSPIVNGDAQPGPGVLIRPERGSGLIHSMSPRTRQAASLDLSPIVNGDAQPGPGILIRPERGFGLIHSMSPRIRQAASLDLSPIVNGDARRLIS